MLAEKIRIQIYGREYEVDAGALTQLEASSLAKFVSDKMSEIARQTNIVDTSKLAVLAALNIADELFNLRERKDTDSSHFQKRADELLSLLDQALK